ncbi:RNA chaperone Hfq [Cupriavidus sp. BIC8F]|uniref:RNA chaperone Hfq n=1 Tax=Cupriavidus sp. BIC8F TaxID=3079014 RepID=UPI00396730A6
MNTTRKERKPVEVYLVNGVRLVGLIASFDRFVVVLSASGGMQAIYKSAISTIQFQGTARQSGSRMRTARDEVPDKEAQAPRVVTRKRRPATPGGEAE